MFKRQHYEIIARVLNDWETRGEIDIEAYKDLVNRFACMFTVNNPAFKRDFWMAACGLPPEEF